MDGGSERHYLVTVCRPSSRAKGRQPLLLPAMVVAELPHLALRICFVCRALLLQETSLEEITSTFCDVRAESSESHLLQASATRYYAGCVCGGKYDTSYNPLARLCPVDCVPQVCYSLHAPKGARLAE